MDKDRTGPSLSLGEAIDMAIAGVLSQRRLAGILDVNPSTVSRWIAGEYLPTLDDIAAVEQACNRPLGWILHLAGYVEDVTTVEQAVAMDSRLTDSARQALLDAYEGAVAASQAERRRNR
jgi:transcriptional regulator with XRE-family HTH domain